MRLPWTSRSVEYLPWSRAQLARELWAGLGILSDMGQGKDAVWPLIERGHIRLADDLYQAPVQQWVLGAQSIYMILPVLSTKREGYADILIIRLSRKECRLAGKHARIVGQARVYALPGNTDESKFFAPHRLVPKATLLTEIEYDPMSRTPFVQKADRAGKAPVGRLVREVLRSFPAQSFTLKK